MDNQANIVPATPESPKPHKVSRRAAKQMRNDYKHLRSESIKTVKRVEGRRLTPDEMKDIKEVSIILIRERHINGTTSN